MQVREITPEMAGFLAGTRAADAKGNPLVLHHGTLHRFDRFERTVDLGFHFGTLSQARRRLATLEPDELKAPGAGEPRIVSVALAARNPLLMADDPNSWTPTYVATLISNLLDRDESRILLGPQKERAGRKDAELHALIRGALLRAGHDSIVYRNQVENARGSRALEWSWVALDPGIIAHLGEDHPEATLTLPKGVDRIPGIDPDKIVRGMGGLRRLNGRLASVADARRFRDAGIAAVETVTGPCDFVACKTMKALSEAKVRIGPALVEVRAMGDIGRLTLKASPIDSRELLAQGLPFESIAAEHGKSPEFLEALSHLSGPKGLDLGERTTLCPYGFFQREWAPGEPLENTVTAFRGMLENVVGTLRDLYEPEVGPRP